MTLQAYQSVKRATLVEGASPHRLIEMLYEGAISNIAIARQHLENSDRALLHASIDKTVAIVQELQGCLKDHETNELSRNLFDLYSFIVNTLLDAEKNLNANGLETCTNLIVTLTEAWRSISPELQAA